MNIIDSAHLWFPTHQARVGIDGAEGYSRVGLLLAGADQARYVVLVPAGRPHGNGRRGFGEDRAASRPEMTFRTALHLVECRNGQDGGGS